jgi:hypothetical protein
MKAKLILSAAILAGTAIPANFVFAAPETLRLKVPYVSEAPGNTWYGSWKNACEEASIAMAQYYYSGVARPTVKESKALMQVLFAHERKLWGTDANSDVAQTLQLIRDYSGFSGRIAEAPTVESIKAELSANRPVIVPVNGFTLNNPHIPFLPSGSGYHMFTIVGYDDAKSEFIANDNGDNTDGVGHRYGYELVMRAIHDYSANRRKADGPARAIFTFPKLAKSSGSHRIYFLEGDAKRYVSRPEVFTKKGWSWSWVNVVSEEFLNGFKTGSAL